MRYRRRLPRRRGEIGRAEDRDGTKRYVSQAEIRFCHWLAGRVSLIEPQFLKASFAGFFREKPQLPDSAGSLPSRRTRGQSCLRHCTRDQLTADELDLLGNGVEERRAGLECYFPVGPESCPCRFSRLLCVGGGGATK